MNTKAKAGKAKPSTPGARLFASVQDGNVACVRAALAAGANANAVRHGRAMIVHAVEHRWRPYDADQIGVAQALIDAGADVAVDRALSSASGMGGTAQAVRMLVRAGADVHGRHGAAALRAAAFWGNVGTLTALRAVGAPILGVEDVVPTVWAKGDAWHRLVLWMDEDYGADVGQKLRSAMRKAKQIDAQAGRHCWPKSRGGATAAREFFAEKMAAWRAEVDSIVSTSAVGTEQPAAVRRAM